MLWTLDYISTERKLSMEGDRKKSDYQIDFFCAFLISNGNLYELVTSEVFFVYFHCDEMIRAHCCLPNTHDKSKATDLIRFDQRPHVRNNQIK